MQIHKLLQGSDDWHQFRLEHYGASEAAAMLGLSKKVKRTELLHAKHTGIAKEFSDFVQEHILDNGHVVEAMARPIIEDLFDIDLYPVTCSDGIYSASCDGLTLDRTTAFEHKQWNKALAESVAEGILPDEHIPQCQQILMVTGAEKVIFVVSDGSADNMVYMEVLPDSSWFERLVAGWEQFGKDLAEYVPLEIKEKPTAEVIEAFPVPSISVRGELVACNLKEITPYFDKYLAETKTTLETDEDFVNGEANAKASREAAKNLKLTAKAVVDQIAPVSEAVRTLELYAGKFDALGLTLEKAVKDQKEAIKTAAILNAKQAWFAHVESLQAEVKPISLNLLPPDFAGAIKGLKTIASLHNNINTCLANAKIEADAMAKDVRAKLAWCKEQHDGMGFLFHDLQQIIFKPMDDFQLVINTRVNEHKAAEAKKEADMRAQAEADARAKVEAEAKAKAEAEAKAAEKAEPTPAVTEEVPEARFVGIDLAKPGSETTVTTYQPAKEVIDTGAKLKLGQINTMLGFIVNEAFLSSLGFTAEKDRNAALYRECDFPAICDAIARHVLMQANNHEERKAA